MSGSTEQSGGLTLERQRQEIARVTGDADEVTGSTPGWRDVTKSLNQRASNGQLPGYYQQIAEVVEQTADAMPQGGQHMPGSVRASAIHIMGYLAQQHAMGGQGPQQAQQIGQFLTHLFDQVQQASTEFSKAGSR